MFKQDVILRLIKINSDDLFMRFRRQCQFPPALKNDFNRFVVAYAPVIC